MKKSLLSLLMGLIFCSTTPVNAQDFETLSTYPKAVTQYLLSTDGIKDVAAAYSISMLITLIHEMGHAAVAKLVCGAPVDIVIGGKRRKNPYFKCAGIEFAGFNPFESDARWEEHHKTDEKIYHASLEQDTAMLVAGPLAQAITGIVLYACLKDTDKFYIAKATAIGGLFDTIVGINGIYGAKYVPWADSAKIVNNIKKYFQRNSVCQSNDRASEKNSTTIVADAL